MLRLKHQADINKSHSKLLNKLKKLKNLVLQLYKDSEEQYSIKSSFIV